MARVIQTEYIGPTNHRPSRVRAWFLDGREKAVLVPYDGDTSIEGGFPHDMAAMALLVKHNTFPAPWADAVRRELTATGHTMAQVQQAQADEVRRHVGRVLGRATRQAVLGGYLYIVQCAGHRDPVRTTGAHLE